MSRRPSADENVNHAIDIIFTCFRNHAVLQEKKKRTVGKRTKKAQRHRRRDVDNNNNNMTIIIVQHKSSLVASDNNARNVVVQNSNGSADDSDIVVVRTSVYLTKSEEKTNSKCEIRRVRRDGGTPRRGIWLRIVIKIHTRVLDDRGFNFETLLLFAVRLYTRCVV